MPPTPQVTSFGRYRLHRKLGEGGMGAVYLAHDTALDRWVALKIPQLNAGQQQGLIERFQREARSAARVEHPNLCPILDIGEVNGVHYLTMPFIQGKPLSAHIDPESPWDPVKAFQLMRQVAGAVGALHERGLIHRDLKPGNILLRPDGEPVLVDFGLAKAFDDSAGPQLTDTGQAVGTPAYMAPEQVLGARNEMGPPTDVYAVGVILFELLTGRVPFRGQLVTVFGQILHTPAPRPSELRPGLSPATDAICRKCLAKNPQERYTSMALLDAALAAWLRSTPTSSPLPATIDQEVGPVPPVPSPPLRAEPTRPEFRTRTHPPEPPPLPPAIQKAEEERPNRPPEPELVVQPVAGALVRSPQERVRGRVMAPAIAMLVISSITLVGGTFMTVFGFVDSFVAPLAPPPTSPATPTDPVSNLFACLFFGAIALANAISLWAAINMLRFRTYWFVVAGSIVLIPGGCFCMLAGIPVGIWSLVILLQPDVRDAFQR